MRADVLGETPMLPVRMRLDIAPRMERGGKAPAGDCDYADNPGDWAYADATALPAALLEAGVRDACFGPLVIRASRLCWRGTAWPMPVTMEHWGCDIA